MPRILLLFLAILLQACGHSAQTPPDDASLADVPDTQTQVDTSVEVTPTQPSPLVKWHVDSGTFDVILDGQPLFLGATADMNWRDATGAHVRSLRDPCTRMQPDAQTLVCTQDGISLTLRLFSQQGSSALHAQLSVHSELPDAITVDKLTPLLADTAQGGSIQIGSDPKDIRIVENGRLAVLDIAAMSAHGDDPRPGLADALPLNLRGNSISNWNHIVADPAHLAHSLVAGFLTFEKCLPTLGIGLPGLYAAENAYIWNGKPLKPGETLDSEILWLQPFPQDPLATLEQYAREIAQQNQVIPWTQRGPKHPVPAGWNSWSGGGGTGGHGQDINEQLILDSLEIYRREFGSFGTNFFQVDDGWEPRVGDWQWDPQQFPHGGKWLAQQIVAAGFQPGVWMAPFSVEGKSQLAQTHPDWLQPKVPSLPSVFAEDNVTLDTSNPEVHAWLKALGQEMAGQGWQWLKVDFSYRALFGEHRFDPSQTHVEAWRNAWKSLREGIGTNIFVCGIGAMGLNVGRVEAMRLTADNGPEWDVGDPDNMLDFPRAFLSTVRTGTRRWFYQNRLWQNHDDLIFFRAWPDPAHKPLTFQESRAFATWIGLMASIVKIGDKLTEMAEHPEWIDVVRRLTPVWPESARPIDLLVRDQPEMYLQQIDAPAGKWQNVGLCNWGKNRDHSAPIPLDMPDHQTRTFTVHCPDDKPCAAYEFWSQEYLGEKTAPFQVTVAPHDCQVLALRPLENHPQLLGENRHLTQGAADLGEVKWDPVKNVLSTTLVAAVGSEKAPWVYHFAFRVPPPYDCPSAAVDGLDVPIVIQENGIAHLSFSLPDLLAKQTLNLRLLCQKL